MNILTVRYIRFNANPQLPWKLYEDAKAFETAFTEKHVGRLMRYAIEGPVNEDTVQKAEEYFRGIIIFTAKHNGYAIGEYQIEMPEGVTGRTYDWPKLFDFCYMIQPILGEGPITKYAPDVIAELGSLADYR